MANILCIETATVACSVALTSNGNVLSKKETTEKNAHSAKLTLFIDEILKENNIEYTDLDAIAISKGPGSYTGLRIGVSTAKGLCYALDLPLISINTLQSLAYGMSGVYPMGEIEGKGFVFCPMLDARRMEVYAALYNSGLEEIRETKAEIIEAASYSEFLEQSQVVFFGDGAEKCKGTIVHPNAIFMDDVLPSSGNMAMPAYQKYKQKEFEDVAYFEPFYLKDFVAGIPKVKGLR
ncbi:MAG: tRNA (adenosine(37)-N6)-threonylcarbamoyltransferase complex dimerization subunit type 1 TsaB [Bacteroidetes bacterium]|nr:MAG: tRNA (adenosine(37)-N6)-threonylcarbamoyltransferase complex dimerization subunit type 1 TsaB [Bacteroidota bacterium]